MIMKTAKKSNNGNNNANNEVNTINYGVISDATKLPPNCAVIPFVDRKVQKYFYADSVKSTKVTDLLLPLIIVFAREKAINIEDNNFAATTQYDGQVWETNISVKGLFSRKLLDCNTIYKTDAKGTVNKGLFLKGITFRDTPLNVKAKHTIVTAKGGLFRALAIHTAKVIERQSTYVDRVRAEVTDTVEALHTEAKEAKEATKVTEVTETVKTA